MSDDIGRKEQELLAQKYREAYLREQAAKEPGLTSDDTKAIGDVLEPPPLDEGPLMQPPAPDADGPSILDSVEPHDERSRIAEQWGGGEAGRSVPDPNRRAAPTPRVPKLIDLGPDAARIWLGPEFDRLRRAFFAAGWALGGLGVLMMAWALTGGRVPLDVVRAQPTATVTIAPATATATPVPTAAQPVMPLGAGPIVATFSGTTTSYTVESVQGSGLKYQWAHSATCGSHTGETTVNYLWDHPHPPCPEEAFHTSFITVQITDGAGFALVRQYPTLGSRPGRGAVPAGGGVFATQTPFPTTAVRTTAPATTAATTATAAASAAAATNGSGPNYPLGLGGLAVTAGGLGLAFVGGRKEKDPCAELRRRDSAARSHRDAAHARVAHLEDLRTAADRTRAEADRTQRSELESKDDRHSWGEDAETGVRTYTNPGDRTRIEHAEAAARDARAAADAARTAYDAAGGPTAVASARVEQQQADVDLRAADAALAACEQENAPRAAAAPPPPAPPAPPVTAPVAPPPVAPTPLTPPPGPVIAKAAPTTVRVCEPGTQKPDSEQSSTHEWRVVDLRSATIVGAEDVALAQGADGDGPDGERGSGAFPEMFQYWRDATDTGAGRLRTAAARDERLALAGEYSIRYTVRLFTISCTTWEECTPDGTGYARKHRSSMAPSGQTEEETPKVLAEVQHADRTTVTREVIRVVTGLGHQLQAANRAAEEAAKTFTKDCS